MRVIAGKAKGHRLKSPGLGTRPMTDRMKESLFSSLGEFKGLKVLDLYAGSGSLGLEALSRGATSAQFIENAREAIVKLEQNIEITKLKAKSNINWADVKTSLRLGADRRYDVIFLDPPYANSVSSVREDLEAIVTGGWLSDKGRIVVHRPTKESQLKPFGLTMVSEKDYGGARILVFEHEEED